MDRPAWRDEWKRLACPALVITAEVERGGIITPEIAREVSQMQKSAEVVQITGAGHTVRFDQFDLYLGVIKRFLLRVTGW